MQASDQDSEFDKLFRQKLEEASFAPRLDTWDKIQAQLPPSIPFYHRHKYAIALAMFSFAVMLSFTIHNNFIKPSSRLAVSEQKEILMADITDGKINTIRQFLDSDVKGAQKNSIAVKTESIPKVVYDTWSEESVLKTSTKNQLAEEIEKQQGEAKGDNSPPSRIQFNIPGIVEGNPNYDASVASKKNDRKKKKYVPVEAPTEKSLFDDDEKLSIPSINSVFKEPAEKHPAERIVELLPEEMPTSKMIDSLEELALLQKNIKLNDSELKEDQIFSGYKIKKGFYIGPYVGVNNNWLTKVSKRKNSNNQNMDYDIQFGAIYGISTGYDFNERWGLVVEWTYSSAEGQKFKEIKEGVKTEKEIKLDYLKMPMLVKYRTSFLSPSSSKPISMNVLFGGHYSYLRSKNTFIDNQLAFFDQKYNVHQWGLQVGLDFDIYLTQRLFITTGARTGFGANLLGFPRPYGKNDKDPLSYQTGVYTKLQFRMPTIKSKKTEF